MSSVEGLSCFGAGNTHRPFACGVAAQYLTNALGYLVIGFTVGQSFAYLPADVIAYGVLDFLRSPGKALDRALALAGERRSGASRYLLVIFVASGSQLPTYL